MTQYTKIPDTFKTVSNAKIDQKTTILGLLTLLSFEFEKMEIYDNVLFKQSVKSAANAFKFQLESSLKAYFKDCPKEEMPPIMDTLNDLCNVIETNIQVSYQLADMPTEKADLFLERYNSLLNEFDFKIEKLTV